MHNDEAGDIFIFECSRIPDLLCGKCPKSKQAYLLCFFEPGEAEQNYLWRQNIELNCNCNWKSQDVYGHPVSLT